MTPNQDSANDDAILSAATKQPDTAGKVREPGVFIVSAPSGSGKTTLVGRLISEVERLRFSVSYTTRNPRGSEQNGRDYSFVSRGEFEAMIGRDELLEWAEVFGNYYGTAQRFLIEACQRGDDLLLDIDVQGAAKIRKRLPGAVSIFILPPSRVEMEARLRKRGQDSEEVIAKRLSDAQREIKGVREYDYVLINDQLEQSAASLRAIVQCEQSRLVEAGKILLTKEMSDLAESCRTARQYQLITPILEGFQS